MLNNFKVKNKDKQVEMDKKLAKLQLEDVNSLWYFVYSTSKRTILKHMKLKNYNLSIGEKNFLLI